MTGGTERARDINYNLAIAAEKAGVALGLGSQRAALEDTRLLSTYRVRDVAPRVVLFANIGAVQLNYGVGVEDAQRVVDSIGANGLYLHFNPLQEALQPSGQTNFRALLPKIGRLCRALSVPVIAKSVGSGISVRTAARLIEAGVTAIDVAGAGGTSWARVEGRRADDPAREVLAEAFAGWGYPTAQATAAIRRAFGDLPLIASGGVRSGVDVAKALALGRISQDRTAFPRAGDALGRGRLGGARPRAQRPAHRDVRERLPPRSRSSRRALRARFGRNRHGRIDDLNVERIDRRELAQGHLSAAHVEAPGVPRTGHDRTFDPAFGERPALVRAGVVDRVKLAADVEDRDLVVADGERFGGSGRNVGDGRDGDETRHAVPRFAVRRRTPRERAQRVR